MSKEHFAFQDVCTWRNNGFVFCYQGCQNILSILGKDAKVYTVDSKFYNEEGSENILNNVKRILVDECSMTPLHWMEKLN